ncbi:hypothetical protein FGB62_359g02 [Gracilaria domingensis]|nr:hypothetical protein FGB62_359g02 [Gracilaria domingensis]
MNATTVSKMPAEDSSIAVYETVPHNRRDQLQISGATTSIATAAVVCATDLKESRVQQSGVSNDIIERGESKMHSTGPVIGTSSHVKADCESGADQAIGGEGQSSRGDKEEADYAVQTPVTEQSEDVRADERTNELDARGTILMMEHETQNRKSSPGSE